jgi:hypothetical protein
MNENKIREMIVSALLNPMPEKINSKEYVSNRKQSKSNPVDTITMDVPLFIRTMEFAREDAKSDLDLHDVAEKAISLSNNSKTLTMSDYETMFGGSELDEKKLTTAEKHKKEDIVKAMKKSFKGNKGAMYAIATDKAKKLAEYDENMLDEAYVPDNIKKFAKQRGVSSLVNKAAGWAEKVGKRITGGTAIGKNYSTLVLDMGYQTGDIHINTDDETIKLYGEEVNSFPEFKKVYMDENSEDKIEESSSKIQNILSKIGDIEEKIYDQYGDDEIETKFDYDVAIDNIKRKYKNDEIKMYDALVSHLNKLKSSFPLKESYKTAKGFNPNRDTPEIKALMTIADDTSKSYTERDKARQKAYDLRAAMSKQDEGLSKGYWAKKIPGGKMEESYKTLVNKIKKQGKSEKASKAIAGAVASYKRKGGGSGPTAKQKAAMAETIMSKLKR